jgi:PAT family beta-lactamase induction signal transducer AmpG
MLALDPARTDGVLWAVLLSFTVISATQDIAIDAYAVDVATPKDSGYINGFRVGAYRGALLFAGSALLLLADRPWAGWRAVWWLAAGICVAFAIFAFASPRVAREHAGKAEEGETPAAFRVAGGLGVFRLSALVLTAALTLLAYASGWQGLYLTLAVLAGTVTVVSFLEAELLRWLLKPEMAVVIVFVVLYKVGDNTLGRMIKPFWVDSGMSATEIGLVSSGLGMGLTIAGALLGGWFIARRGIFSALVWMGLAQLVSNFGYVAVAALDLPRGDLTWLGLSFGPFQTSIYCASVIESVTQGLGTAAFLSFLMNLCDKTHAATQFALLTAAFSLSRDVAGAFSGIGVEALGYPLYFTVTACLAIPALLLLPWIKGRIREEGVVLAQR